MESQSAESATGSSSQARCGAGGGSGGASSSPEAAASAINSSFRRGLSQPVPRLVVHLERADRQSLLPRNPRQRRHHPAWRRRSGHAALTARTLSRSTSWPSRFSPFSDGGDSVSPALPCPSSSGTGSGSGSIPSGDLSQESPTPSPSRSEKSEVARYSGSCPICRERCRRPCPGRPYKGRHSRHRLHRPDPDSGHPGSYRARLGCSRHPRPTRGGYVHWTIRNHCPQSAIARHPARRLRRRRRRSDRNQNYPPERSRRDVVLLVVPVFRSRLDDRHDGDRDGDDQGEHAQERSWRGSSWHWLSLPAVAARWDRLARQPVRPGRYLAMTRGPNGCGFR